MFIEKILKIRYLNYLRRWIIKFVLKLCNIQGRNLFLYFKYFVSVTAGGPESNGGHM